MLSFNEACSQTLTPAMAQYVLFKKKHPSSLLFFQMGDFFELFFEDAALVAKELGLALTQRGKINGKSVPMCGLPIHASQMYLSKLLRNGHTVAICVQEKSASVQSGKAPIARFIEKILTPGTAVEDFLQTSVLNQFLMVIAKQKENWGIALFDASTGDVFTEQLASNNLKTSQLLTWNPKEILVTFEQFEDPFLQPLKELYKGRLSTWPLNRFKSPAVGLRDLYGPFSLETIEISAVEANALCVAADYAQVALGKLPKLSLPKSVKQEEWLFLDAFTRKNLELTEQSPTKLSLRQVMDCSQTGMGGRLLTQRLLAPSRHLPTIQKRLETVQNFVDSPDLTHNIRLTLKGLPDLQRALNRLLLGRESPRDLASIRDGIFCFHKLVQILEGKRLPFQENTMAAIKALKEKTNNLYQVLQQKLCDIPPPAFTAGQVIKAGASSKLDELRDAKEKTRQKIEALEKQYQEHYHLPFLRIRFNNLIGFFVEVPRKHHASLPEKFVLRQGMAQTSRYITPELQEIYQSLAIAEEQSTSYEKKLFLIALEQVLTHEAAVQKISCWIGQIDFYTAQAHLAVKNNYVRPNVVIDNVLEITAGRHPIIEQAILQKECSESTFTPNNCTMNAHGLFHLITAPNMAGKSTYLRQNALLVLMAHMGSFIPAQQARIGLTDAIFSRLGAHDDLASGHSTFMIEMLETAHILRHASERSLVILDEVGRGTSTCDGLAIAKACVSYLAEKIRCRTFFATHYFELTTLENSFSALKNYTLRVHEEADSIAFLHHVVAGKATSSYGLEVARLAGLPEDVLNEAKAYKKAHIAA